MSITTRQAADKLGVSCIVVRNMAKRGLLTDLKPIVESHQKHYGEFDVKQVNALRKVYRPFRNAKITASAAAQIQAAMNGAAVVSGADRAEAKLIQQAQAVQAKFAAPEESIAKEPKAKGITTRLAALEGLLERVERKVDKLLVIWA